jgi:hypothetical protein
MGVAAIPLLVASTAISAYGAYRTGQSESAAAQYQAGVARNNQTFAERYAQQEEQKGIIEEQAKRQQTAQQEGHIRAGIGGSGIEVSSGSPLRLQTDTAALGELDAETIRNNAAKAAYTYRVQGMNYAASATADSMRAGEASRMGSLGAFSSIIGGAANVSEKWARLKASGTFSS